MTCPDCTRIAAENRMLQRAKQAADKLLGVIHIRYTFDNTDLSRILKKEIDAYEQAITEGQIK
jgi:hypothetical protein